MAEGESEGGFVIHVAGGQIAFDGRLSEPWVYTERLFETGVLIVDAGTFEDLVARLFRGGILPLPLGLCFADSPFDALRNRAARLIP